MDNAVIGVYRLLQSYSVADTPAGFWNVITMSDRPNIIWLTIESTRADHTSLHGYSRETTPAMSRIAELPTGRSFDSCFSHGIWTLTSSASILSGLGATRHNVSVDNDRLADSIQTVPERLQEIGYTTACLSTNPHVSRNTGLDRGFDRFRWLGRSNIHRVAGFRTLAKYAVQVRKHGPGFTLNPTRHSTGYLVTDILKRWIRDYSKRDDPIFLYAHYAEPHHPYYPPKAYESEFVADTDLTGSEAVAAAKYHSGNINNLVANGLPLSDRQWEALAAMYDAEIAYADSLVGHLFEYVQKRLGDVIVVITGDHGELFGEKGMLAHKVVLNDAVSHVPLVVHGSDNLRTAETELIQHADVMRTLLEAVGADTTEMQGKDLSTRGRQYAITQRRATRYERNVADMREYNPEFSTEQYFDGKVTALRTDEYTLKRGEDRTVLHRLPDERQDVKEEYPKVAEHLTDRLVDWLDTRGQPIAAGAQATFTDDMEQQLSDLGYLR